MAVLIAGLALIFVNPFMANDRVFGQSPGHYFGLALPALAAALFLHAAAPRGQRAGIATYTLRVLASAALAYFCAAVILVGVLFAVTGELL